MRERGATLDAALVSSRIRSRWERRATDEERRLWT
jgi:hypothetical protein